MVETMRKPSSLWMGKEFKVGLKYTERLTQMLASVLESKDKMGPDKEIPAFIRVRWRTPLPPALRGQRQVDL